MEDPKPIRQRDEEYKEWVVRFPCVVTGRPAHDPNHLDHQGSGGSDYTCVPMTRKMHTTFHNMSLRKFEGKYGINLWRAAHQLTRRYFRGRHNHNDPEYLKWITTKNGIVLLEPYEATLNLTGPQGNDYAAVPTTKETCRHFQEMRFRQFEQKFKVNMWRQSHKLIREYFTGETNMVK